MTSAGLPKGGDPVEEAVARALDPYGWQLVDEATEAGRGNPERARAAEIYRRGREPSIKAARAAIAAHIAALTEAGWEIVRRDSTE